MQKKKRRKWPIVLGVFVFLVLSFIGLWGVSGYMEHQEQVRREEHLYKHGFKLYEEQVATYIKEYYSGVSKIEFSPIFLDGDNIHTMATADIVPVIYDKYGNQEKLGDSGKIDNLAVGSYGILSGLDLDFDGATGEEIITLKDTNNKDVDVQNYKYLPDKAKLSYSEDIDDNISELVKQGYLKDIEKNAQGSPHAKVVYNTKIQKGNYTEWR